MASASSCPSGGQHTGHATIRPGLHQLCSQLFHLGKLVAVVTEVSEPGPQQRAPAGRSRLDLTHQRRLGVVPPTIRSAHGSSLLAPPRFAASALAVLSTYYFRTERISILPFFCRALNPAFWFILPRFPFYKTPVAAKSCSPGLIPAAAFVVFSDQTSAFELLCNAVLVYTEGAMRSHRFSGFRSHWPCIPADADNIGHLQVIIAVTKADGIRQRAAQMIWNGLDSGALIKFAVDELTIHKAIGQAVQLAFAGRTRTGRYRAALPRQGRSRGRQ